MPPPPQHEAQPRHEAGTRLAAVIEKEGNEVLETDLVFAVSGTRMVRSMELPSRRRPGRRAPSAIRREDRRGPSTSGVSST
jgi:hypothetical protein